MELLGTRELFKNERELKKIGFWEAYSIGVGGMIGGGIFAVLGLTILLAKGAAPIAFLFAGFIALLTAYSYAKLSVRYPSEGGTVEFLVRAFGNGILSSYLNTLLLASYVIMLALYSYAFGSYADALFFKGGEEYAKKIFVVGVVAFFTLLNFLGAYVSGKWEDFMVLVKVAILLFFSLLGFFSGDFHRLSPEHYESALKIMTGGLIIFLAYEGFELIANTAQDIKDPQKNLPRAYYASVLTTIFVYVLVAAVAVANLTYQEVEKYQDFALAVAAKPLLGEFGFTLIGIAALLSTSSAINATLYGGARVSYLIAKTGALPRELSKRIWKEGTEGLAILAVLSVVFALVFNLENISIAGSLGFLLIFAFVNLANFRLYKETASNRWISLTAAIFCFMSIFVLIWYNLDKSPQNLISAFTVLLGTFLLEAVYVFYKKRRLENFIDFRLKKRERVIKNPMLYLSPAVEKIKKNHKEAKLYKIESPSHIEILIYSKDSPKIKKELRNTLKHTLGDEGMRLFNIKAIDKQPQHLTPL